MSQRWLVEAAQAMKRFSGYGCWMLAAAALVCALPAPVLAAFAPLGAGRGSQPGSQHGVVGYLGVDIRDVGADQAAQRPKDVRGAVIVKVDHDAPAGKCGLREHDIILTINGLSVEGEGQLRRVLHDLAPGRTVALVINRDGQTMNVTTQMADRELVERQAWEQHIVVPEPLPMNPEAMVDPDFSSAGDSAVVPRPAASKSFLGSLLAMTPSYTGAMLEVLGPQLADFFGVPGGTGLLVRSVAGDSPAAVAGLRAGDVAVRASGRKLSTTNDWLKTIRESKGRPVTVVVLRDKREVTLTLTPDGKKRSALELPADGVEWAWARLR